MTRPIPLYSGMTNLGLRKLAMAMRHCRMEADTEPLAQQGHLQVSGKPTAFGVYTA